MAEVSTHTAYIRPSRGIALAAARADTAATWNSGPPPPAIALQEVSQVFKSGRNRLTAVDQLSLDVAQGEVFGLLGPNGSGKTTLINMICGLVPPTSGVIEILGRDIRRDRRRRILPLLGVVPQETAMPGELSVKANMTFNADLYGVPRSERKERIDRLLHMVGLTDRGSDRTGTLSGGQQRRLAIARALLHNPRLIILDEPTLGVDPQAKAAIWGYIRGLGQDGKTVLVTTNQLDEVQNCDRVAIIDHGRLVQVDTPAQLRQAYGFATITAQVQATPRTLQHIITDLRLLDVVQSVIAHVAPAGAHRLKVSAQGKSSIAEVVTIISGQGRIVDLSVRQPSLDEVFLGLTGDALRD